MTCTVPEGRMDVLRERLGLRAYAERIPLTATVEIIATCIFAC